MEEEEELVDLEKQRAFYGLVREFVVRAFTRFPIVQTRACCRNSVHLSCWTVRELSGSALSCRQHWNEPSPSFHDLCARVVSYSPFGLTVVEDFKTCSNELAEYFCTCVGILTPKIS